MRASKDYFEKIKKEKLDGVLRIRFANIHMHSHVKTYDDVDMEFKKITGIEEYKLIIPLLFQQHYRKYSLSHWMSFCDYWKDKMSRIIIAYNTRKRGKLQILALAFVIEGQWYEGNNLLGRENDVYVRCICSGCFCGGETLRFIKQIYRKTKYRRIKLNAEPDKSVLHFYKKHGFTMLKECYIDQWGIRYPEFLYCFDKFELKDGEEIEENPSDFYPGLMYYVFEIPKALLSFDFKVWS